MKQINRKVLTGIMSAGALCFCGLLTAGAYTRYPEHPRKTAPESSNPLPIGKADPNFLVNEPGGNASFEETTSRIINSPLKRPIRRERADNAYDIIGNIYGVCNSFSSMSSQDSQSLARCFWGKIDFDDYEATPIFSGINFINTGDPEHQAGAVRDGILYIPEGQRSSIRDFQVIWKRLNINTGEWLSPLVCSDDLSLWPATMCYDPKSDAFIAMTAMDENGTTRYGRLVSIKLNETTGLPEATVIKDYPERDANLSGIFYNPAEEEVMTMTDDHIIYYINLKNGNLTPMCELFCDEQDDEEDAFRGFDYIGSFNMVYSPRDHKVIWSVPSYGRTPSEAYLFGIDLDDGCVTRLGNLSNGTYMISLYTPDTYAEPDAADMVTVEDFSISGNSLNGSVKYVAPSTLYNGLQLSNNVDIVAHIDGNEVYRKAGVAPGSEGTFTFTVDEGLHKLAIRADVNAKNPGPDNVIKFYAGNDTPLAPTNVKLNENTISWSAPGNKGFNNGYVDSSAITYDIYFDGIRQNSNPVTGTSFTFPSPDHMSRVDITVTASFAGKTSQPSSAVSAIIGDSLTLPYSATPETAQAALFTVIDANRDGSTFQYDYNEKKFLHQYENYEGSNDWLILPALYFDNADKMYEFACSYQSFTPYYGTENISVYIGERPEANAMRKLVEFPAMLVKENTSFPVAARFAVEKPGKYYLAFHARTPSAGAGSRVYNFRVNQLSSTTGVPALPASLTAEAQPLGGLNGILSVKLPTVDAAGKALNASETLTAKASNLDQDPTHTASATGLPGETVTLTCPATQGFNSFQVSVTNAQGEGAASVVRHYIGIDIPKIVTNFKGKTSEDNMTMELSWDPVTEGVNGGFIDPDNLKYQVWYNPSGVTWNRVGEAVKENRVIFDPAQEPLYRWRVSVFAENSAGFKKAQTVEYIVEEILGRPNTLPVVEPFSAAGAAYGWNYNRNTPQTENSSIRSIQNDELAVLGIGNPRCDDGSGRIVQSLFAGQSTEAELYVPKFSTVGMKNPTFEMLYWNYANAPRFKVFARSYEHQEPVEIADVSPDPTSYNSWRDYILELPEEFQNKEWVQLRLYFYVKANNSYGVIDDINIYSNVDNDLKVTNVSGEFLTKVGDNLALTVSTVNGGRESVTAPVNIDIIGDGFLLDRYSYNVSRLRSLRSYVRRIAIPAKTEYLKYKKVQIRVTSLLDNDELPQNDVKTVDWEILTPSLPLVYDLSYSIADSKPTLTWSEPKSEYGSFDEFEYLTPFIYGEKLGQWKNFNNDNFEPYAIAGLTEVWPHWDTPRAWQVVNDTKLGVHNDPRIGAHSGQQYLMAFSGWDKNNPDASVQVSKWLISPEVKGGQEVKFWVNTPEASYRETIHVMVSTTDDNPESFYKLCNRSKEGSEGWEQTSFILPEDAKYFALVYVGWDSLGILIDDIQFTPSNPRYWNIDNYEIYRKYSSELQYTMIGTSSTPSFTDSEYDGRDANYYVVANGSIDNVSMPGPNSNIISVDPSGINIVESLNGVYGAKGEVKLLGYEGKSVMLYSPDGKLVANKVLRSNDENVVIAAGIYVVVIDDKSTKVVVK